MAHDKTDDERARAEHRLERLTHLVQALKAEPSPAIRARYAAQLQRLTGWVLRDAVTQSREADVSWRDIARRTEIPFDALRQQYDDGGQIFVGDDTD
jgi:hypothetical protein